MLFGFVCFCRGSPNNPELFRALKAVKVEGVKVDSLDYIFIKTASGISNEQIMMTLSTFGIRPVSTSNDSPEILTSKSCSRQQRQSFFRHIRFHRARYHQGLETCYWYWLQPPLDIGSEAFAFAGPHAIEQPDRSTPPDMPVRQTRPGPHRSGNSQADVGEGAVGRQSA